MEQENNNNIPNEENNNFEEEMVFCPKCGCKYKANFVSCPQCGTKNNYRTVDEKPKKKSKAWKIILGVIGGIAAIVIIASLFSGPNVQYIGDRSAQFDDDYNELQILFSFKDDKENRISSDATFEIEVINDNNETVYKGTKTITENDFGKWTSPLYGERLLGCVRIPENEIKKGSSSSGKVHFTVYKDNKFYFDESIVDCIDLPVEKPKLITPSLPITLSEYSYFGTNTIKITKIDYEVSEYSSSITINLNGEKVSGGSGYTMFNYKILDSSGTIVDSGTGMASNISNGDKFQEKIYAYNIEYGKTYTLELSDYSSAY